MEPSGFLLGIGDRPIPLHPGRQLSFGRGKDNDFPLKDGLCSRRHAVLRVTEDDVTLEDLGSTNKTWVNEAPIKAGFPTPLSTGDIFRVGGHVLTYLANTEDVAPAMEEEQDEELATIVLNPSVAANLVETVPSSESNTKVMRQRKTTVVQPESKVEEPADRDPGEADFSLKGDLTQMTFPQLLMVLHHSQRTGRLALELGAERGIVGFDEGKVVFAQSGNETGVPAIQAMASWRGAVFLFDSEEVELPANVLMPTTRIILQCCKAMADEDSEGGTEDGSGT